MPTNSFFHKSVHLYRGHPADSFYPIEDTALLVELRARQRTFHGAYSRSALGSLGYGLTILRLFDQRFYKIGLLFAALAFSLSIMSFFRDRHSRHDFADSIDEEPSGSGVKQAGYSTAPSYSNTVGKTEAYLRHPISPGAPIGPIKSVGQGGRIFGRPFVTAGHQVLAVSGAVLAAEIALVVLILRL